MRRYLCLLPLLAFAACATGPGLESRMAALTGASAATLVQEMGVPDKQITVNGVQYLAYTRNRTVITPGVSAFGGFGPYYGNGGFGGGFYGGSFFGGGIPPQVEQDYCETTFLLKDDKVQSFTLRGNDCN